MSMKESEVLEGCIKYLRARGIFCFRNNVGATKVGTRFIRFGYPGSSDILGIMPDGRFLAVECKREKGGRLSELQKAFLTAIQINGGVSIVARSVEELKKELENAKKITLQITNKVIQ